MPTYNHFNRDRNAPKTLIVTKIVANTRDLVALFDGTTRVASVQAGDQIENKDGYVVVQGDGQRQGYRFITDDIVSVTQSDGTVVNYAVLPTGSPAEKLARLNEIFDELSDNIFKGCCGSSTESGGGGAECTPNPLLDDGDTQVTTIAEGQSVKMVTAGMTHSLVGSVREITCPVVTPPIKAVPLIHQLPGYTSLLTGDYADTFSTINTFYEYADACKMVKQGADAYTLHADTPNPFGTTRRYTTDDGTGSGAGTARITTFGSATDYIVCDWLYRIMWYVANLDQNAIAGLITEVAARNTAADVGGFSDWRCATNLVYNMSARPDRASDINSGMNILLDGIVSGFNPGTNARNTTNVHWAQDTTKVWGHFGGTGNQATQSTGYTTDTTGYMWRHILDADITAMGGTP